MSTPILATKLYIPPPRPQVVRRSRLVERLNTGLPGKLTLISAAAGYGKTTLVSEWINQKDEGDNDPIRFLTYLVAALQTVIAHLGVGIQAALQSPQPPPSAAILTALLNEVAAVPDQPATGAGPGFVLVLDDCHVIEAPAVNQALTFLIEHLPPQLHLVIATREDPQIPLARLRARGQLTEVRAADLRFTPAEAADFLNQAMGLQLAAEEISTLESRTEGWIAGLQLAALSLQSQPDTTRFIQSFSGSHRFVLDYLVEEVLLHQAESIQTFLLRTSLLDRLCGPLCDAVLLDPATAGQATLEYLEQANLFIIPLDNERRWYRYHHLFAELLRRRWQQNSGANAQITEMHQRASQWYADNDLELEAFQHAVAAHDVARAARLAAGNGRPLIYRGSILPVLNWLETLPTAELDAQPKLWVMLASAHMLIGRNSRVEPTLQAAERALHAHEPDRLIDAPTRDLVGCIASIRGMLAMAQNDLGVILSQSLRALELLSPDNLPVRALTTGTLGFAYQLQGNRVAARQAYRASLAASEATGLYIKLGSLLGLAQLDEAEHQLQLAAESYRQVVQLAGDPPWLVACEAYHGLARIAYQWNDLAAAQQYGELCLQIARPIESIDTTAFCDLLLALVKLAQHDARAALELISQAEQFAHQHKVDYLLTEAAALRVLALLQQGNVTAAAQIAQAHDLPGSQARVHLAQGDAAQALAVLDGRTSLPSGKSWEDQRLTLLVLQSMALAAHGATELARQLLGEALALAEPGGYIRLFVAEGEAMAQLLLQVAAQGARSDYIGKLLAAFAVAQQTRPDLPAPPPPPPTQPLIEPLSQRELEVLQLIAHGLSNQEIGARLFLALDTVKGHNRRIFEKLAVQRRTEAVAKARLLKLLAPQ